MKTTCLLFLPLLCFTSCATITRGPHDKLYVNSEPSGAEVQLTSGERGVTPAKFVKKRREHFSVTVSKAGYLPQTIKVESKMSATGGTAMAGNVIAGAGLLTVVGIGVDASTGAMYGLYPNPVSVRLVPSQKSKPLKRSSASAEQKTATKSKPPRTSPKPESSPKVELAPKPENLPTPEPSATPPLEGSPTPERSVLESVETQKSSPTP